MLAATHALTGAAIAKLSPSLTTGVLVALISHPILDYIPHWDLNTRHTKRPIAQIIALSLTDALIGFLFGFLLFGNTVPMVKLMIIMFAAQLPDWFEAPYRVFNWKFPPFSWVKSFQHKVHKKLPFPDGLLTQLILIFSLLLITN